MPRLPPEELRPPPPAAPEARPRPSALHPAPAYAAASSPACASPAEKAQSGRCAVPGSMTIRAVLRLLGRRNPGGAGRRGGSMVPSSNVLGKVCVRSARTHRAFHSNGCFYPTKRMYRPSSESAPDVLTTPKNRRSPRRLPCHLEDLRRSCGRPGSTRLALLLPGHQVTL